MSAIGATADHPLSFFIQSLRVTETGWEADIQEVGFRLPQLGRLRTIRYWMLGGGKRTFRYRPNCGRCLDFFLNVFGASGYAI